MVKYIIDSKLARRDEPVDMNSPREAWNSMAYELYSVEGKNRLMLLYEFIYETLPTNMGEDVSAWLLKPFKYEKPIFAGEISKDYDGELFTVVSTVSEEDST